MPTPTPMPMPSSSPDCAVGRHLPRYKHRDIAGLAFQRSACRCCGVSIVKSTITRRWIVSGLLG